MKGLKYRSIYFLALLGLMYSVIAFSQTVKEDVEDAKATQTPIVIKSNTMVVNNTLKLVTFTGDVKAEKDDFVIDCDKMTAYYESMSDQSVKQEETTKINKIVASGNVIINRAEGGVATAEKATYHQKDERMVLTGNPTVKRGSDVVKGEQITIFLKIRILSLV